MTSNYLAPAFEKRGIERIVKAFGRVVEKGTFGNFSSIVCSGVSGTAVGPVLAYEYEKNLVIVRKKAEKKNSHCEVLVEGNLGDSFVICDDFMESGATLQRILETIRQEGYTKSKYVGVYFWNKRSERPIKANIDRKRRDLISCVPFAWTYNSRLKVEK